MSDVLARFLVVAALLALGSDSSGSLPLRLDADRLGWVSLFEAAGDPRAIVFLLGARSGWSAAEESAAGYLSAAGAVVIGVDLPRYLQSLARSTDPCLYLVGDIERLSHQVQRREGFRRYREPIVAGVGEGGALAQALLAQSPPATIAGVVAVDPLPLVKMARPFCHASPPEVGPGFDLESLSAGAPPTEESKGSETGATAGGLRVRPLPKAANPEEALAILISEQLAAQPPASSNGGLDDLPLVQMPPARPGAPLFVVLSGDGGWRDLDRQIAEGLNRRGFAVLGWDSLRYFWEARTPEELGRDLAKAVQSARKEWLAPRVGLVGYSFGADVLPFAFNRLPSQMKAMVSEISLLGFSGRADFQIRVAGWFALGPSGSALPAASELKRIDARKLQCFYGAEESDSVCPQLAREGAEVIETGGGHHFGGDYARLTARIASGLTRRACEAGPPAWLANASQASFCAAPMPTDPASTRGFPIDAAEPRGDRSGGV